ncbi:hypothetical protein BBJ28_00014602 [Nothophytophthora sp. Chile5]|nr:hypothetical protein BBJ28_00014602 [Nothophytophthora sp. Chile5]
MKIGVVGRYAALLLLGVRATCSAVDAPAVIQLEMTNVAREQAVEVLRDRYRQKHLTSTGSQASPVFDAQGYPSQTSPDNDEAVEVGLRSGAGSHTIMVTVGGQQRELIIDTGSGKTAFICEGCVHCGSSHIHEPFALTANTTYLPCDTTMLAREDSSDPGCLACEHGKCKYGQTYVEGDEWTAYKASDIMELLPTFEARIEFGCIFKQSGVFNDQSSDGIMGFSRHPDAIYEQFYRQKVTSNRIFAQCLTKAGGLLTLGGVDLAQHTAPVRYTPLRNTGYQYWTVSLLSMSIGDADNTVKVDATEYNDDRGCVLDSGTTFVYLPQSVLPAFRLAWSRAVGSLDYVPTCNTFYTLSAEQIAAFPDICFWFKNAVHICMPASRYFVEVADGVYSGAIFFTPGPKATILGASILEGHDIIYDVDNHRVGIAEATCEYLPQAMVELSLDPGGDKFQASLDYSQAPQWMLAAVTLLAVAGLVNAIWVATATDGEVAKTSIKSPAMTDRSNTDWHDEEFAFFLMQEDDPKQTVK